MPARPVGGGPCVQPCAGQGFAGDGYLAITRGGGMDRVRGRLFLHDMLLTGTDWASR